MRKPNYSMERKDRERAKQAKAAAKLEKRTAKAGEDRAAVSAADDEVPPGDAEGAKREA
jgi:hypothetical protein